MPVEDRGSLPAPLVWIGKILDELSQLASLLASLDWDVRVVALTTLDPPAACVKVLSYMLRRPPAMG